MAEDSLTRLEHERDTLTAALDRAVNEGQPDVVIGALQRAVNEVNDRIYVIIHGYPF